MRIIGGIYRSRKIDYPLDESKVRPTKDVVRQAVFNALGNDTTDMVVLDLFAGSGAYALEAISHGAKFAYAVDNYDLSINCIKKNSSNLKVNNIKIIKSDYKLFLNGLKDIKFDLVFLDPPYKLNVYEDIFNYLLVNNLLSDNCVVIMETDKNLKINDFDNFIRKDYNYKDTNVIIFRR